MTYQLGCSIYSMLSVRVRNVNSLNCLGPSISAFLVEPKEQDCGSPVRVASLRRLQKCPVEVLAFSIPTRYVAISTTAWDRIFGCCYDDIAEVLVGQIHIW